MSNHPLTRWRVEDKSGRPVSGAKRYYYEGGSSTPLATYTTRARTISHANPVVANSHGYLPVIFLTPGVPYKIVTTDAAGSVLETVDDFYATSSTSAADSPLGRLVSPYDYGAVGDGVTDDAEAVQAAIDAASAEGFGQVMLLGGTFRCDATIVLKSNVDIVAPGTLDFTSCTDSEYISATGTEGSDFSLNSNVAYAAATVASTAATGVAAGNMVRVKDTSTWRQNVTRGELNEIASVSGVNYTLDSPTASAFLTASSAAMTKITPVERIRFRNGVRIIASTGASGAPHVFHLEMCRDISLDVRIEGVKGRAVHIEDCLRVIIDGPSTIENLPDTGLGTAVYLAGAGRQYDLHFRARRLSIGVDTSTSAVSAGAPREVRLHRCTFIQCTTAFVLLEHMVAVLVDDCLLNNSPNITWAVTDGTCRGLRQLDASAISITGPAGFLNQGARPYYYRLVDNHFEGAVVFLSDNGASPGSGGAVRAMEISRNWASGGFAAGLTWDSSQSIGADIVRMDDNHCLDGNEGTILIDATGSGTTVMQAQVNRNTMQDVTVKAVPTVYASENDGDFIYLVEPQTVWLEKNVLVNVGATGAVLIEDALNTGGETSLTMIGNKITSDAECIHVSDGFADRVLIDGNMLVRTDDAGPNVLISANAAGDITGAMVHRNNLVGGTYGVSVVNGHSSNWADGNSFLSMATGNYNGAIGRRVLYSEASGLQSASFSAARSLFAFEIAPHLLAPDDLVRVTIKAMARNAGGAGASDMTLTLANNSAATIVEEILSALPNTDTGLVTFDTLFGVVDETSANMATLNHAEADASGANDLFLVQPAAVPVTLAAYNDEFSGTPNISATAGETLDLRANASLNNANVWWQVLAFSVELLRAGT